MSHNNSVTKILKVIPFSFPFYSFLFYHNEMDHYRVVCTWAPDIQWSHTFPFTREHLPPPKIPCYPPTTPLHHSPALPAEYFILYIFLSF